MDESGPKGTTSVTEVIGGAVLGWLGSWLLFAVASIALYSQTGDGGSQAAQIAVALVALFVIPVAAGAVLIRRGRGQLGSGMLLGVAIGSVVGAGVCTSTLLVGGL